MKNEFDERQLYLRGKIFRNGFIILLIYLLADAFMKSNGINPIEGMWGNILIIVGASSYCMIDMIIRGAVDLEKRNNGAIFVVLGILGAALFIWGVIDFLIKQQSFFDNRSLSQYGARLIIDLFYIIVGVVYICKLKYNVKDKEI